MMHCGRFSTPLSRRDMLLRCANGLGAVALAALLAEEGRGSPDGKKPIRHHPAKAASVIFLYMDGGPSQVDTFEYKPLLAKHHGKDPHSVFKVEPTQFDNVGKVMASPWKFRRHGQSGLWVSKFFPNAPPHAHTLAWIPPLASH